MPRKPRVIPVTAGGHITSFEAAYIVLYRKLNSDYDLVAPVGGIDGLEKGNFVPIDASKLNELEAGAPYGADRSKGDIGKIASNVDEDDIVIMMGGDNHLKVGKKMFEAGINVAGYPKTMDGDTNAFITCGWDSAVTDYAEAIRRHHTTAVGYKRLFFVGMFGRDRDGVLIPAAAWGGADIAIPCEGGKLSWQNQILPLIKEAYERNGKRYGIGGVRFPFAVIPFAEGAVIDEIPEPPEYLQSRDAHGEIKLQPEWVAMNLVYLATQSGLSAAQQVYTYSGRDRQPTTTDIILSQMAANEIAGMIREGDFGKCVTFEPLGGFYMTARGDLGDVSEKRNFRESGLFDYEKLVPNIGALEKTYGNLFSHSLGAIPTKDQLVHKTLQG